MDSRFGFSDANRTPLYADQRRIFIDQISALPIASMVFVILDTEIDLLDR